MDNTVATVSNEDLQRQLDQQAEQLAKLIKIGTDTALNNQSLLELQKQFGVFIDRYSTNDIKQWEAVGTAQTDSAALFPQLTIGAHRARRRA